MLDKVLDFLLYIMFLVGAACVVAITLLVIKPVEKHTGRVAIVAGNGHDGYIMERPNHELFFMKFDQTGIGFEGAFEDITYIDASKYERTFIKAMPLIVPTPPMLNYAQCVVEGQ